MASTIHDAIGVASSHDDQKHFNPNANQWLLVMKSIQTLDETLTEIDSNLKTQSANIPMKIKELLTKDHKSVEQSWEGLRTNWTSKCREISSLKKAVNRASEEKTRLRDENQGLEKSITRLQEQFSQSVNSSLTEIQTLTAVNSDLSDQLQKMEEIKNEYNGIKENLGRRVNRLGIRLQEIVKEGKMKHDLDSVLKEELEQIDTILAWNRFDENRSKDLIDKADKIGKSIERTRLETMETHLQELEKELTEKNERIKGLEKSNEDFLQERNVVVSEIKEEERNWFDYMKRSIMPGKLSQEDCLDAFEVAFLSKGIKSAKQLVMSAREGIAEVYRHTVSNEDALHEVRDSADEVVLKLKSAQSKLESAETENEYFKRKLEQEENKLKVSRDEVISLQGRIHMLAQEKEALEFQIGDIKGGKEDFKEFCSNLSTENEKLFGDISRLQAERDSVLEQQQETSKKLANCLKDCRSLEEKCEVVERQLVKLKRDYQEQSRELEHCMKENEELKVLLHTKEDSFSECKNEFRNIDIVNKDLEDQVFQLTNDNQKLQLDIGKMKSNKKLLETELKEKKLTIEKLVEAERILEGKVREMAKFRRSGENDSSHLKTELEISEEILEKSLDKVSGLAELVRQLFKQIRVLCLELCSDKEKTEFVAELDNLIKNEVTNDGESLLENRDTILNLLMGLQKSTIQRVKGIDKYLHDIQTLIMKTGVKSEFPDDDQSSESSLLERLSKAKMWLSWVLKDYKKLCETPSQVKENEGIRNLKDVILKYVLASTKQLEAMFEGVAEKDCVIMLLPNCKEQAENSTEGSNEDLLRYVRETFRANQMALETAIGTLEQVKLRGESDIVSKAELEANINEPEHRELCQILKRMNQAVDSLTTRVQGLITNAEMIRSTSTSSFENGETQNEIEENGVVNLQIKALKTLVNKRDIEIDRLRGDVHFLKMEREQILSELQEKNFDLGKLGDEIKRMDTSSSAMEEQLTRMRAEYDKASKELVEREQELVTLKEKMDAQQDREGDAGELSSTESAKSEIERKENELRRLRSSLEDIRNVHCTNEDRIKTLQNKIEGVTNFLSKRENTIPEEEQITSPRSHKEQLLVVREIELKTSQAQFCDAEDLKKQRGRNSGHVNQNEDEIVRKLQSKEKENAYLQSVVKEMKAELMSVQQSLSHEEQSRSEFNNMMMGKDMQRSSNRGPPSAGFDDHKLRRRNMEYQKIRRNYRGDSDQQTVNSDEISLTSFSSPKHFGYPPMMMSHEQFAPDQVGRYQGAHDPVAHDQFMHDQFAPDCEICAMEAMSGASTYICSDDECDCNYASCELSDTSYASEEEFERSRMVSPGFKGNFSREARNVSLQEATVAIKNQHRRNITHRSPSSPSPVHNLANSPRHRVKRQSFEYDKPVAKYTVTNLTRSNSARNASRPASASSSKDYFSDRRSSFERRSLERRPRSDMSSFYAKEHLAPSYQHDPPPPKSPSHHSSDECSSLSSGSGPCSGSGTDGHDCRKRPHNRLRGKLV